MIDILVGAGIAYGGVLLGRWREAHRKPKPYKEPEPICGCEHHYSFHDETGKCTATYVKQVLVERGDPSVVKSGPDGYYRETVYAHERWENQTFGCPCKRYIGPEPLPRMIS